MSTDFGADSLPLTDPMAHELSCCQIDHCKEFEGLYLMIARLVELVESRKMGKCCVERYVVDSLLESAPIIMWRCHAMRRDMNCRRG
jgi:hypothetical protein